MKKEGLMSGFFGFLVLAAVTIILMSCPGEIPPDVDPELTGSVTITGTAKVGEQLTANISNLDGTGTVTYQWRRGNTTVGGNTSTYMLVTADAGSTITVTVTRAGYTGSRTSAPTAVIAPADAVMFNITWHLDGGIKGSGSYPEQIMQGTAVNAPSPSPTKEGYNFDGWFTNSGLTTSYNFTNTVNSHLNLYAKWTQIDIGPTTITYTVIQTGGADNTATTTGIQFTFSGSINDLGLTAADINISGAASKGTATLTGSGNTRTLSPITVNDAGLVNVSINKSGIEIVAKTVVVFKEGTTAPAYWNITWHLNGGIADGDKYPALVVQGESLQTLPNPVREGFIFDSWFTDAALTQGFANWHNVTGNLTLYAKWSAIPLTSTVTQIGGSSNSTTTGIQITFSHTVTGSGLNASSITLYDESWNPIEKNNAVLTGSGTTWTLSPITISYTGTMHVYISVSGDLLQSPVFVFKAGEDVPVYNITWHLNGGIPTGSFFPAIVKQENYLGMPSSIVKAGFVFGGWYTDPELTMHTYGLTPTSDLNLYARWTRNIDITINLNNSLPEDMGEIAKEEDETSITFSIENASSYNNFIWYHNGIKRSETTSSITIDKEDLEEGPHRLTIIARLIATGDVFSREIFFRISE